MSSSESRKQRRQDLKLLKKNEALESTTQGGIIKYANEQPYCYAIPTCPDGRLPKGTPDILICIKGIMIWLEVKQHGKESTPAQKREQRSWSYANAIVAVVHSIGEGKIVIDKVIASFSVDETDSGVMGRKVSDE